MATFSTDNIDFPVTTNDSDVSSTYCYSFNGVPILVNGLSQQWSTAPYSMQQQGTMVDARTVQPIFGYSVPQTMITTTPNLNNNPLYETSSATTQSFLNKDLMQNIEPTWYTQHGSVTVHTDTTPLFDETLQDCMNMLSPSTRVTARPEAIYSANNNIIVAPSLSEPLIGMVDTKSQAKPTERKRIKSMSAVFEHQQQWNGASDSPTPTIDWHLVEEDPEALPRLQKPRYKQDEYNPKWVRYSGHLKEGYCDTCGRWLQLKNSAYWYHKQFYHGISSVSGQRFLEPLQQRLSDEGVIEGLCHQCGYFVPICNGKRQKNSLLWYKHAHKCHVYNKPEKYTTTPMTTSSHHSFPL
ncbi:hypothetical protein BJV82DRAFT_416221 [Fennellomyces sp. T-0311]|nr:hypothetical protein BJV82DRAFT_416221 [Fennellomyces sp. T-0311]